MADTKPKERDVYPTRPDTGPMRRIDVGMAQRTTNITSQWRRND
jgi:hypothetical protein